MPTLSFNLLSCYTVQLSIQVCLSLDIQRQERMTGDQLIIDSQEAKGAVAIQDL